MDRDRQPERRRHPRTKISWPVLVEGGGHVFHTEAVNVSVRGAKLKATAPRILGTLTSLQFHPPGGQPVDLWAVVWRLDSDGTAFFFLEDLTLDLWR